MLPAISTAGEARIADSSSSQGASGNIPRHQAACSTSLACAGVKGGLKSNVTWGMRDGSMGSLSDLSDSIWRDKVRRAFSA